MIANSRDQSWYCHHPSPGPAWKPPPHWRRSISRLSNQNEL